MAIDTDRFAFPSNFIEPCPPTCHDAIIRDDQTTLVTAQRSRNTDGEWEVRKYRVYGPSFDFHVDSLEKADLAALFLEEFDGFNLTRPGQPSNPTVPPRVAVDGAPAVAAWLVVTGSPRPDIARLLSVSERTVVEYLSRFRSRGTGIPDDVDAPEVGSILSELPPSVDYSGGEEE